VQHDLTVRAATVADIARMAELLGQLFAIESDFAADADTQRRGLELLLGAGDHCVLVAETDGFVVGMCTAQLLVSTAEGAPKALLEDLVVDADHRGHRIGSCLLREAERWAQARGATRIDLLADQKNHRALAFYTRENWRRTELVALQKSL